ncbi:MAG: hypothetical protein OXI46_08140 [Gemmatimonadota bacterium]|nr:hypothetical protein [Gemmatimonadota bacterium]
MESLTNQFERQVAEFGGLQAALKRSIALEDEVRRQAERGAIRRSRTWRTMRLAGARY